MNNDSGIMDQLVQLAYSVDPNLSIPDIESELSLILESDRELFLEAMFHTANTLALSLDLQIKKLMVRELDNLLLKCSKELINDGSVNFQWSKISGKEKKVLLIGTEFYLQGGHNQIARRIINETPETIIVVTDIFQRYLNKSPLTIVIGRHDKFICLKSASLVQKIQELIKVVQDMNPEAIFLDCHPQDPISIIAGLIISDYLPVRFIHHADRSPCLGATLSPPFEHLDLFDHMAHYCSLQNLQQSALINLSPKATVDVTGYQSVRSTIFTCGSPEKFHENNYELFINVVVEVLNSVDISWLHVGYLPQEILAAIHAKNSSPKRFIYYGIVDDLFKWIEEKKPSLFVDSFPIPGGFTVATVATFNIPIAAHFDLARPPLSFLRFDGMYPKKTMLWSDAGELKKIILSVEDF